MGYGKLAGEQFKRKFDTLGGAVCFQEFGNHGFQLGGKRFQGFGLGGEPRDVVGCGNPDARFRIPFGAYEKDLVHRIIICSTPAIATTGSCGESATGVRFKKRKKTVGETEELIRLAAFEHVRRLSDMHDHLTSNELKPGFVFQGERIATADTASTFRVKWA